MSDRLEKNENLLSEPVELVQVYRDLLASIAEGTEGLAAVAWDGTSDPLRPICQFHPNPDEPIRVGISRQRHVEILQSAIQQQRPVLVSEPGEPDRPVIAVASVPRNGARDLIEVFLKPNQPDEFYQRCLTQIEDYCTAVGENLPQQPDGAPVAEFVPITPQALDHFVDQLHQSIDLKTTCYQIANQTQDLLRCDRVSVIRQTRGKCKTIAISGLPKVNRRANAVRAMEKLARAALKTKEVFWYPHETEVLPQIQGPLNEYLTSGVTRSLAIIPVHQRPVIEEVSPERRLKQVDNPIIGAIVLEHFSRQWTTEHWRQPVEVATRHGAAALRNAIEHRRLFLYPVWHLLGKSRVLTTARNLPKTVAVAAALLLVVLVLWLIPADFYVTGNGVFLPRDRHLLFAQEDGVIVSIIDAQDAMVRAGQPLITMESADLDIQLTNVQGKMVIVKQQRNDLLVQGLTRPQDSTGQRADEHREADLRRASLSKELENLTKEEEILLHRLSLLTVTSPIDGQIVTWDPQRLLENRPVVRGEQLLEVANIDGEWEIQIDLPDRRIGHLQRAQRQFGPDLDVSFILAADPSTRFRGTIVDVDLATQVTQDAGHTIRVVADPGDSTIDIRQVRTDVVARIYCGKRSLGYVWLSDLGEFLQSKVFFYLW